MNKKQYSMSDRYRELEKFIKLQFYHKDDCLNPIHLLIRNTLWYYKYTYIALNIHQEIVSKPSNPKDDLELERIGVSAFGVYTNGRVCLKSTEMLNNFFQKKYSNVELKNLREEYKDWVKKFIERRNIITAHPIIENKEIGEIKKFYELARLSNYGSVLGFNLTDLGKTQEQRYKEKLEKNKKYQFADIVMNPVSDFKKLHEYLEKLAVIYADMLEKEIADVVQ